MLSNETAFLIGPGGQVSRLIGPRGETPPCAEAKFKRGDVVKVRNTKALANFPREAVVAVAIPPGTWATVTHCRSSLRRQPSTVHNSAIAAFGDNEDGMIRAIAYLKGGV
jgi:hypothetical protein